MSLSSISCLLHLIRHSISVFLIAHFKDACVCVLLTTDHSDWAPRQSHPDSRHHRHKPSAEECSDLCDTGNCCFRMCGDPLSTFACVWERQREKQRPVVIKNMIISIMSSYPVLVCPLTSAVCLVRPVPAVIITIAAPDITDTHSSCTRELCRPTLMRVCKTTCGLTIKLTITVWHHTHSRTHTQLHTYAKVELDVNL